MARKRKNPLGTPWWLIGLGAAGAYYYLYMRPRSAGRPAGVTEAARLADKARYEWQYFGKGDDRDAVCRDKVTGKYVDDGVCEKLHGPQDAELLEGFSNYVTVG